MYYTLSTFYQGGHWRKLMAVIKDDRLTEQGELICEHCGKPIIHAYDCIGHHKIYLTEENVNDADISLNPKNVMLVHHRCHNHIHNKLGYVHRKVYVVWGSPLSGKTSWVMDSCGIGDLIVDMDSIWQCVSGCDRYVKPARLKQNVFAVRDLLIDMVRMRRGKWNTAYVIGGYPLEAERRRLIDALGAESIFIDTPRDVCLARLHSDKCGGRNISEWERFIDDWWRTYSPHSF